MAEISTLINQHFLQPRNVGDLDNVGFSGRAGSITCGATMRVHVQVDENHRISDAKFQAAGCSFLVAAASLLTEEVKGALAAEVGALLQSPATTLTRILGELPPGKSHCVKLVGEGFVAAIRAYSDSVRDEWHGEEALICTCFCVSEKTIETVIATLELRTVGEVTRACNAGGGCRSCHSLIEDMLASSGD